MLRELAARHAYSRFDAPQSSLRSQSFGEVAQSDSFGAKPPDSLTSDFIYVSDDFRVQTGAKLTENLFVGKPLGCGLQVQLLGPDAFVAKPIQTVRLGFCWHRVVYSFCKMLREQLIRIMSSKSYSSLALGAFLG